MPAILTLLRKDIRLFLRNRTALSLTFIVPLALVYVFGNVFGVNSSSGPTGIKIAVVNQSDSTLATTIIGALQNEPAFKVLTQSVASDGSTTLLTEERVRELMRANEFRFALIFPTDTVSDETFGLKLKFLDNPRNEIESQMVNGLLQKLIFTNAPQALMAGLRKRATAFIGAEQTNAFYDQIARTVASSFGGDAAEIKSRLDADNWFGAPSASTDTAAPSATSTATPAPTSSNAAANFLDRIVKIEHEQVAGANVKSPAATRVVGGWAIMFLLFSVSGASTSLFEEKRAGLFLRLLASPVSRAHILWSKYLFNVLMGLVQLTVLFLAGQVLFGIEVTSHLPGLFVVALCASIACTAFGMLLAAVSSSPAAASGLATFLILMMSAVGGAWFPISFMPEFIQSLSKLTLVYWSMEGFLGVLWADQSILEILPTLSVLLGIAAVVNVVSLWRFNRGQLFN